ncbi:hypothetical protein BG015_011458 [Linnemannia schmuckeri]|uniref:Uncharacterized protein n=1 Tax=Linnemannia schmuckeri TaxID=64567 RepID=A0A9P5VEB8_9FUNG|nr:hypothetical protein BG015_011458 [Linnemannia schmuckeri]
MAPPKQQKMPSMKELQDLLQALDAEGGLAIGGGDESANLDDLFEDSYFHAILHNNVNQDSFAISSMLTSTTSDETTTAAPSATTVTFETLTLPQECAWGDDHESLGSQLLVRPGYQSVLSAIISTSASSTTDTSQTIFMATGGSGIGKSSLAYYLVHQLHAAGHNVVISDPMFTNALLEKQYYSCYSPHLEKHSTIHNAISTPPSSTKKPTWWICDDGFLPIKGTNCHVIVTGSTATTADKDTDTIRKKNKLAQPVQFQIPKWSLDEIKAGLLVSLSSTSKESTAMTKEQEAVLESLFKKFKGNPKKTFAWVKENWTGEATATNKTQKSKSNKPKRS